MTNTYLAIKNAIIAKLQTLTKVHAVFGYEKGEITDYPAITVYSAEYNPEQTTTGHDIDKYVFTLHLYQEMQSEATTPETAERIVDEVMVDVIQAFQLDPQLGGVCDNLTISASKGWVDRELINRACVFTIVAEKIVEI